MRSKLGTAVVVVCAALIGACSQPQPPAAAEPTQPLDTRPTEPPVADPANRWPR
ncbi:disulfide bond formation protein DsbD, partial [Stenotrophomonas maltophilia]